VIEPFAEAVSQVEEPVVLFGILWIFSSFGRCQFANGRLDWNIAHRVKVNLWQLCDHLEANVTCYQVLRLLLLSSLHNIDPLSRHNYVHVHESDHEGELRMREFLWMAQ